MKSIYCRQNHQLSQFIYRINTLQIEKNYLHTCVQSFTSIKFAETELLTLICSLEVVDISQWVVDIELLASSC